MEKLGGLQLCLPLSFSQGTLWSCHKPVTLWDYAKRASLGSATIPFWNMTQNRLDQELPRRRRAYLVPVLRVVCGCLSALYPWVSNSPGLNCYNERLTIFFMTLKFGQGSEQRPCPCSLMQFLALPTED